MPNAIRTARRRFRPRRRFRGGKRPVRHYQLRRTIRRVFRRIPKPQRKYLDTGAGNIITPTDGNRIDIFSLAVESTTLQTSSSVVQGVSQNQLIGYKGMWKTIKANWSIMVNPEVTPALGQFVRILLFFWKPNELSRDGTSNVPTIDVILQQNNQAPNGNAGYSGTYLSVYNKEWGKQYKILFDKTYALSTVGQTSVVLDKTYRKLRKVFQCLQPGQVGGLYDWSPWVAFIYDTPGNSFKPQISFYSRMGYINF